MEELHNSVLMVAVNVGFVNNRRNSMSFYIEKYGGNIWAGKFSVFPESMVKHAVSTRSGGVSAAPFNSLNLALHVGDEAEKVKDNRKIFLSALGLKIQRVCTCEQVHGNNVHVAKDEDAGRGSLVYNDAIPNTDALLTNVPDITLMLCFADCTPLLFFDPINRAIGIAHGGWRGTAAKIAVKTLERMNKEYDNMPDSCLVGIGPAIGSCCYEIGNNVADVFKQRFSAKYYQQVIVDRKGKLFLDLSKANRMQLEQAGVKAHNIEVADTCTYCNSEMFFSYRAAVGGKTGRIAAVLSLLGNK